jgi:hypothetical protein
MQGGIQMRRKTFDLLAVVGGLVLAVVLVVAGGLLLWGHNFVNDQVRTQLAAQKIYFPPAGSAPIKALPSTDAKAMTAYAGQLMTDGVQAQTYADHFIAVHLREIGGGKTYAQLAEASLASPKNAALAAQVQTVFRGETLRGLLLNAYAFWKTAQIMLIGAIVAFVAAGVMLIMSAVGVAHLRHVPAEAEMFSKGDATAHTPATVS